MGLIKCSLLIFRCALFSRTATSSVLHKLDHKLNKIGIIAKKIKGDQPSLLK